MSYAGPARAASGTKTSRSARSTTPTSRDKSTGRYTSDATLLPEMHEIDWRQIAVFGAGLTLGVLLGAGSALLAAPQTGAETRAALRARATRFKRTTSRRSRDTWDELRDELRGAARSLRRRRAQRAANRSLQRELEREEALLD